MGLLRDRESELPLLQRLVARLQDAARRHELSADEWAMAMVAYGLDKSEDPTLLSEGEALYADFVQSVEPEGRSRALSQLSQFVNQRRGKGWQALLLFAMGEAETPRICSQAATLAVMSAPAAEGSPFPGATALVELVARQEAPPALLGALLSLPELRLLPVLQPLYTLPPARLHALLAGVESSLNTLSASFILQLLEAQPCLAEDIVAALLRFAAITPLVADIALPIPTWAFEKPTPQPLHAWALSEYLPRMLPRLQPHLNSAQIERLRAAFV